MKTVWKFLKKKIDLHNPTILFLDLHPSQKWKQDLKEIFAQTHLYQHYSELTRSGKNQNAYPYIVKYI